MQVGGSSVYYRTSDLAIVQWGSRGPQNYYITFDPPLEWFRFPLLDRQNWSAITDATFYNGMNRSNTTGNFRFLVSGPETFVLPAGTFHTMGVQRQRVPWPDVISTAYYSDEVGFAARFSNVSLTNDQYYRGYGIPSVVDLREHHHASSRPFGLLTIVLVAGIGVTAGIGVVATFLFKRRRNRTKAPRETPVHSLPARRPPP